MWQHKNISYEVLTGQGGRWLIDSTHRSRQPAMNRAQALGESNQHDAVKVVREEKGKKDEIVFQKECAERAEKSLTVSPIEESPVCNTLEDLYGFEARKTVGRLLRQYLDEFGVTALELMHDYGQIKALARMDNIYNQAIHRVSSIQARALGEKSTERNDRIYALIEKATGRLKDGADIKSYKATLKKEGLTAALDIVAEKETEKSTAFTTGLLLASLLGGAKDWKKKLDLVLEQIEKKPSAAALERLDEAAAEILDGSEAVKEILGPKPDLGSALRTLAQLGGGRYDAKDANSTIGRLNAALAENTGPPHRMARTQAVLLQRVVLALQGVQPFTRESDDADLRVFTALFKDLIWHGGLLGGPGISGAVTRRARMALSKGAGDLTPEEGIEAILILLPSVAAKLGYLLDLSAAEFGVKYQKTVLKALLTNVQGITRMAELVPAGTSRKNLVLAVEDLNSRLGSGMLAEELGDMISNRLQALLAEDAALARETAAAAATGASQGAGAKPAKPAEEAPGTRTIAAGEYLFREGDPGDEAYLIKSGEVEISISSDDKEMPIAKVGHGDMIGEMALIDDQPRMASAKALTETVLTVLPQENFKMRLDRLADTDRVLHHMLEVFVTRLRNLARNI